MHIGQIGVEEEASCILLCPVARPETASRGSVLVTIHAVYGTSVPWKVPKVSSPVTR